MNPAAILLRATYAQDLTRLLVELSTLTGPLATVKRVTLAGRICEVLAKLGATAQAAAPVAPPPTLPDADDPTDDPAQAYEPVGEARGARAALYSFDPNRKPAQRRRENAAAVALLKQIQSGEIAPDAVTEEHRAVLAKYSGNGGNLTDEDGKKGSPFEYYTPLPIAEGTWQLLREMGFSGGRVLDPSGGTGIFGASAPKDSVVDAIELSGTSGAINQIVNGGPGYKCRTASFEEIAAREDDDTYDAVITNVPFGDASARGASKLKDPRYQDESLEGYFILTGLRKLKPGGFAAFIVPERVVSGRDGAESRVRMAASRMAEFRGAYRLPSTLFVTAGAEVITDIIVFQKHSAATREKVRELVAEGRQDVLKKANVLWDEFLDGRYFAGEGRKFVMGEFVPKNPDKFRDVNRVKSDKSPADVARLLTKFGPSRINFAELDAVETLPIIYSEGDTMQHDGLTLQLRAGEWVPIRSEAPKFDAKRPETFGAYPMNAFDAGLTWDEVDAYVSTLRKTGRAEQLPEWMHALWVEIQRVSPASRGAAWGAVLVGAAAEAAFSFHQQQEIGFDYTREYPKLTAAMEATAADARAVTVGGAARSALQFARTHYSKRRGFDSAWRGDVAGGQEDTRGSAERFSAARYRLGSVFVPMEEARAIYGEDFDPMHDSEWCISPDGASVARADDVFVGNVGDVVGQMRKAAAATASDDIRDKMVAQISEAHSRADRIDVSKVEFNLFSPLATMEQKAEFLRRYYDEGFVVGFSDSGEKEIIYSRSDSAMDTVDQAKKKKLYRRMSWYLKHGTVTMGGAQAGDRKAALADLRKMTEEASEKFNLWARSNDAIMGALEAQANDVNRLVFRKVKDTTAVPLPGWKLAAPPNGMIPHSYQYSFIRQQGRQFGGINGYSVGLGKTSTALAATLYVQSIGVKKKTVFAVPNSVLSNWYKESLRCYDESTMARCLFVGMTVTEDGSPTVKSSDYDRDLNRISENRHDKIFMTFEALGRLKMQEGTISDYIAYVSRHDASMAEAERKADDIKAEGKRAGLAAVLTDGKPGGAPFIETLGIDSLVLDEAHCFPAGTMVDGRPIESLRIGDMVRSLNHETGLIELRPILDTMSRKTNRLVRVNFDDGRSFSCTPDHPVYVIGKGYVLAEFLAPYNAVHIDRNAEVFYAGHVQKVLDDVPPECSTGRAFGGGESGLLLPGVLGERGGDYCISGEEPRRGNRVMRALPHSIRGEGGAAVVLPEGAAPGHLLREVMQLSGELAYFTEDARSCQIGSKGGQAAGKTEGTQLASDPGGRGEKCQSQAGSWNPQGEADQEPRRQWDRHDEAPGDASDSIVWRVGARVRCPDWASQGGGQCLSLQDRRCHAGEDDRSGGGRKVAQVGCIEGEGSPKGCLPGIARVAGVEVLERGSSGEFGGLCHQGLVYDITVEGNHNFFAEGVLVHNCAKNSSSGGGFKQARFLSLAKTSGVGDWMQAVAWYIRGRSEKADGVLCLTATPITNSPLEIHAMLSLATGRDKVNDLMMGASGAEQFLEMICDVEMEDDESIDGIMRQTRVFRGLRNVDVLRRALGSVATIETPETVGMTIKLPDEEQSHTAVEMPAEMVKRLQEYKGAFRWALDSLSGKDDNRGDEEAYNRVQAKFGEPMALIGHPFNMVRKMARLIVDPDLDEGGTVFYPGDDEIARKAVEQFNKLKLTEERPRPGPLTAPDDAKTGKVKQVNADDDPEVKTYKITVRATMDITAAGRSRVVIDTMDGATQAKFEAIADKLKLELDVSVPPKLAALVENVSQERAMPRGVGGIVKQIIFCDELGMHRKIVRLLAKRCGVSAGKIAIITGQTNNRPEDIIDVQDGFNAHGPDNRYEVIVANEKAEVGINLQQGTQAIHHLTIGWTPDSLTQRNGRGVRQGNVAEYVRVYSYDAVGTFDVAKRAMVNRKADWISSVMDTNGGDRVAVTGGLTREQEIALIDSVGDPGAIERHMAKQAETEKKRRADSNRQRQQVGLDTILSNRQFLEQNKDPAIFATRLLLDARVADDVLQKLVKRRMKAVEEKKPTDKIDVAIGNARTAAIKAADAAKESFDAMDDAALRRAFATMDDAVQKGERLGSEHAARVVQWGRAKLKDQCPARDDWAAQVDQAKAILAEAIKSFAGRAGEDGAMPAFVAQSFADGEGVMHEGRVIIKGSLLSEAGPSGGFGVVVDAKSAMQMTEWGWNTYSLGILIKDGTTVTIPGDPAFHSIAVKIAAAEDALLAKKAVGEGQKTIADYSPEVAALRKVPTLQEIPSRLYLPMPCLPKPILKAVADQSGAGRHFWGLQMKYLTALGTNSGVFAFDPSKVTLSTVPDAGQSIHGRSVRIAEMARSLGDRVEPGSLQGIGMTFDSPVLAAVGLTMDGFMDAIRAADDIQDAGGRHIIEKLDFFEFPSNAAAFQWLGAANWAFAAAADGLGRERKREARRLADIAAQEASTVAAGAVPSAVAPVAEVVAVEPDAPTEVSVTAADTSNGFDITGMSDMALVGVRGDTERWYKTIKACQERHLGKARYVPGVKAWNIRIGGWKILIRDYPQAAKDLILCKSF